MKNFLQKYLPLSLAVILVIASVGIWKAQVAKASVTLIAHAAVASSSPHSSPLNMTGATLFVMCSSVYTPSGAPSPSDSSSNTWTLVGSYTLTNGDGNLYMYYVSNPTTSSSQTFSDNGAGTFGMVIFGFSGIASSPLDQTNGSAENSNGFTTIQPGSITPSQNNELVTSCEANNTDGVPTSINSSMTIVDTNTYAGGASYGGGNAYIVQTSASAINPTWTKSGSNAQMTAGIASWKTPSSATPPTHTAVALQNGSMAVYSTGNMTETPCQTGCGTISAANYATGSQNLGYQFTPLKNGVVTKVCINVGDTLTYPVSIYSSTGTFLASTSITGVVNSWACSVGNFGLRVSGGASYIIVIFNTTTGTYNKGSQLTPLTIGDITITTGLTRVGNGTFTQVPNVSTTTLLGLLDLTLTSSSTVSSAITN